MCTQGAYGDTDDYDEIGRQRTVAVGANGMETVLVEFLEFVSRGLTRVIFDVTEAMVIFFVRQI